MTISAKYYLSVNGGANADNGVEVPSGATIAFVPLSTAGWTQVRWEIYDYPEGWATPAGWTLDASGVIYSTAITPPVITLPLVSVLWGVWMARCLVNEQVSNDQNILPNLYDDSTSWSMLSAGGLRSMGAREKDHFTSAITRVKRWVRNYQRNLKLIESLASPGGSVGQVQWNNGVFAGTPNITIVIGEMNYAGTPLHKELEAIFTGSGAAYGHARSKWGAVQTTSDTDTVLQTINIPIGLGDFEATITWEVTVRKSGTGGGNLVRKVVVARNGGTLAIVSGAEKDLGDPTQLTIVVSMRTGVPDNENVTLIATGLHLAKVNWVVSTHVQVAWDAV